LLSREKRSCHTAVTPAAAHILAVSSVFSQPLSCQKGN
jgi:hypothetical protein